MFKKMLSVVLVALVALVLVSCGPSHVKVTFDTQGGNVMASETLKAGSLLVEPSDPTHSTKGFVGWFTSKDGKAGTEFNFYKTPVKKDTTLYAVWHDGVVVRFRTKTDQLIEPLKFDANGGSVANPNVTLTKKDFKFEGWFNGRQGLTWLEPEAVTFPFTASESMTLNAYWEPVSSVLANWASYETYVSSMTSSSRLIINPLEYEWSHETDLIDDLVTKLYSTEVDWDLAIDAGVADFPGDFSKIENKEYSIDALDYHYILVGATEYPVNEEGESAVVNGKFDRDLAQDVRGTVWTYEIRDDLKFEDGTPIDAYTFEFTLKNWIDPAQNNYRANMWYKTEENKNGRPVVGTYEYFTEAEGATWEDVGFKVIDKYTFEITTTEDISLASAVGMGNDLRLVHPAKYTASINQASGKSQYGTPTHKFMSYGPYVIKTWDENAKLVLNKNFDYVLKGTINYKAREIQIVDDTHTSYQLFKNGVLSVLGLSKEYYAEFAEDPRVKDSWVNFPQYMIINQADSKLVDGHEHPSIIADARFRQALLFGFDRKYFAYNVYAPNKPTLLPIPNNTKNYLYDPIFYNDSTQHLDLLDELDINVDDFGYDATKAVALFDEAYDAWIAEGNTGPVTLKYITDDAEFSISLDAYIKESYENLFEKDGVKRLILNVVPLANEGLKAAQAGLDFDLMLTALGFGESVDAYWQYIAIALSPKAIGADGFGLVYPEVAGGEDAEYLDWEVEVDFGNAYAFLSAAENLNEGYAAFLDMLDEDGFYRGTVDDLVSYMLFERQNPFDGGPDEPFAGASEDLNNMTAAFERVFLEYAPLVPTVTRASSTLYASSVTILWPEYNDAFGWGAARYRFLNTDPDFK